MQAIPLDPLLLPAAFSKDDAARHREAFLAALHESENPTSRAFYAVAANHPGILALMDAVFGNSPYLTALLNLHPGLFADFCLEGPDACFAEEMHVIARDATPDTGAMLRQAKGRISLLVALADIGGLWKLKQVTRALSDFADACVQMALDRLLKEAADKGLIAPPSQHPSSKGKADSGFFVLGMGKLGARELNYSSDIDLILLYNPEKIVYTGGRSVQHFAAQLAQSLVTLLSERTRNGYVFRVDLRLRPDPASTPPAVTTQAAVHYYETVGQNWERAAMLKARIAAGDKKEGIGFLKAIQPFLWRRHLDFAAIDDILSIKRQMQGRGDGAIRVPGHNIKTGRGGIREIEFLGQVNQLIWGGRLPQLRQRGTLRTLLILARQGLLEARTYHSLAKSYRLLRTIEHRLQMILDEQTHTIPEATAERARLACFLGFESMEAFEKALLAQLQGVHAAFIEAFRKATPLGAEEGRLVFTGVDYDPATLETLHELGFKEPEKVAAAVQDWHKGNRRATRTLRSRELLTELMPALLAALGETADPDGAFQRFDEFMTRLPAGVQIFSLLGSRPDLLSLIAEVMGSAPALGHTLSDSPQLLYAVLTGDFYGPLPDAEALTQALEASLARVSDEQDAHQALHTFRGEKQFQVGIQLLKGMTTPAQAAAFLSDLAEVVIRAIVRLITARFRERYGDMPGGEFAVIGLGRVGSREMMFGSDLDLVFVYDVAPPLGGSSRDTKSVEAWGVTFSGDFKSPENEPLPARYARPPSPKGRATLSPAQYYTRLAQRIIGALTAASREGKLYEVDTRLRPFGTDGPVAVNLEGFARYYRESAWLFERLAITRARVIEGTPGFAAAVNAEFQAILTLPADAAALSQAVFDTREKIAAVHFTENPWDIKYVRGGLMDADFIVQYYMLLYGKRHCEERSDEAIQLEKIKKLDCFASLAMTEETLKTFHADRALLFATLFYLRLYGGGVLEESAAPRGLKRILAEHLGGGDFAALKQRVLDAERRIGELFETLEAL